MNAFTHTSGNPCGVHRRHPSDSHSHGIAGRLCTVVLLLLTGGINAYAQQSDAMDPVERSMYFIEQAANATELMSSGKAAEALPVFQELTAKYADLDKNGFVAISIGDCLGILDRLDEARAAYQLAAAAHPEIADSMRKKIVELDLAGEPTDELIQQLRTGMSATDKSRFTAAMQLARALPKRAKSLLTESAAAFRFLSDSELPGCKEGLMNSRAVAMEDMAEELNSLIQDMERAWNAMQFGMMSSRAGRDKSTSPSRIMDKVRSTWVARLDGREIKLEMQIGESDCSVSVTADGKNVQLSESQRELIRRHLDRINTIALDAVTKPTKVPNRQSRKD